MTTPPDPLALVASNTSAPTAAALTATLGLAAAGWVFAAAVDLPLALAIIGLGALILIEPSSVPGLAQPMI